MTLGKPPYLMLHFYRFPVMCICVKKKVMEAKNAFAQKWIVHHGHICLHLDEEEEKIKVLEAFQNAFV